jgi:hypothetical protein
MGKGKIRLVLRRHQGGGFPHHPARREGVTEMANRTLNRRNDGRFVRPTLAGTFGLLTEICPSRVVSEISATRDSDRKDDRKPGSRCKSGPQH